MLSDVKQRWINALRSGRYKQAQRYLRTLSDKYCCLGVLCDLVQPKGWNKSEFSYSHNDCTQIISCSMCESTGLAFEEAVDLATLNDSSESFEDIARYIEAEIPSTR